MKNGTLVYSLSAATLGLLCCFEASLLTAQEQDQQPREFQGERPQRPKQGPPGQPGQRPERGGDRQGPGDGNRPQEGSYQGGRPNPAAMLMRMSGRILIVAPAAEAKAQQEVEEDMTTMLHLVERVIEKDLGSGASGDEMGNYRGIPTLLSSDSRATYLDDYGVIFTLRTTQVLNGPANAEKPVPQPGPRGTQWERARQELYGERSGDVPRDFGSHRQYDAAKVAALKESLLSLLRDASNLRHLKPDQSVAVILTGSPSLAGLRPGSNNNAQAEETPRDGSPLERFRTQLTRSTTLVLRAKKADIDAFAQGRLTIEQFKGKVSVVNN
ncbi:MAG TPA: hypothetical protein VGH19_20425 [Verrucomicrobiae bacterium]